jgi:indole-3-glycerol phosphate synthase
MILDEILAHKRTELSRARALPGGSDALLARRAEESALRPRGFAERLRAAPAPRIVAELKRRSPSRGEIRPDFDPSACARAYADGGAAALSVLTDERYFGGHLSHLEKVRAAVALPLLRKDFVVEARQVDEARLSGADAVLLIAAALDPAQLRALAGRAAALGLDALVEVHDEAELDVALASGARLVGINNRDLRTFETDLAVTERLAPSVPADVLVVAESGIFHARDLARLARAGAHAFLVGESLMRQPDLAQALRALRRGP